MASYKKKTPIAILGAGIAGLSAAARLEKAGLDYLLLDAQDFNTECGGLLKSQSVQEHWLDYGLKSIPVLGSVDENPLVQLKAELGLKFSIESFNDIPRFFENKSFSDFVGFGETKKRQLVDEIAYYTLSPRLLVGGGWKNLVDELLSIIPESKRLPKAHVTRFVTEEDRVITLEVNGESTVTADKIIFTFDPSFLKDLTKPGVLAGKLLQRIARTEPFTAISLDLATPKASDQKNIFILHDTPKDKGDELFVVGQFSSNIDPLRFTNPSLQISTWMTLIETETLQNDEDGSKVIKAMKKVISKAFPNIMEKCQWERLLVVPGALGNYSQLTLEKNATLPGLTNLWVCGGKVQSVYRNVGNALHSARTAAQNVILEVTESNPEITSPAAEGLQV